MKLVMNFFFFKKKKKKKEKNYLNYKNKIYIKY